jgi:hypothetical protein
MEYITTGGSTGIPFGFYRTPKAFGRELAAKLKEQPALMPSLLPSKDNFTGP